MSRWHPNNLYLAPRLREHLATIRDNPFTDVQDGEKMLEGVPGTDSKYFAAVCYLDALYALDTLLDIIGIQIDPETKEVIHDDD